MNIKFFLLFLIIAGCSSKTPVDMDEVLYDRSGQYITSDNYDPSLLGFMYNQKVYNGPGFLRYRSGEKREQGTLKNGFKSGPWTGYDKKGNKKLTKKEIFTLRQTSIWFPAKICDQSIQHIECYGFAHLISLWFNRDFWEINQLIFRTRS